MQGEDLAVAPFKPTCHHQHHEHQQHLEGGDGQHRQTRLCSIPSDACRATDLTEQGLHGVGRRRQILDEGKRGEAEEKRVGGRDQRCRAEDGQPQVLETVSLSLPGREQGQLFLPSRVELGDHRLNKPDHKRQVEPHMGDHQSNKMTGVFPAGGG